MISLISMESSTIQREMKRVDNPFTTLGLNPAVVRGHTDDQIQAIIKTLYRTLSTMHHPDKGGSAVTFRKIASAYEVLSDQQEYLYWKELLLRSSRQQVEAVRQELEKQIQTTEEDAQAAWDKLNEVFYCWLAGKKPSFSKHPPMRLRVTDIMRTFLRMEQRGDHSSFITPMDNSDVRGVFDLEIDAAGKMTKYYLTKVRAKPSQIPKSIHPKWRHKGARPQDCFYWKRTGKRELVRGWKIIGTISEGAVIRTQYPPQPASFTGFLRHTLAGKTVERIALGYDEVEFEPVLNYLSPIIKPKSYLVAAKALPGGILRFTILGKIQEIMNLPVTQPKSRKKT